MCDLRELNLHRPVPHQQNVFNDTYPVKLEKGMVTHSSNLAWEIPWTEEPGGLQSMESEESDTT